MFGLQELFDIVVTVLAAGFIFMDAFRMPASGDPVADWKRQTSRLQRFWYSAALVAPAIVLHELGHKFVAISQGLSATYHAAYTWLGIGVLIKLVNFPFLFLVPAFVSISPGGTALQYTAIAFAGPAVNLALWLAGFIILRTMTLSEKWMVFWHYVKIINGFLFIFNMIPIPGFDGSKVFAGLMGMF